MIYQLPNGKTVYLSLEEYLNLTDEDVQYLISTGIGASPTNPFYGSAINKPRVRVDDEEEEEVHDNTLDYQADNDELEIDRTVNLDDIPDEDPFAEE